MGKWIFTNMKYDFFLLPLVISFAIAASLQVILVMIARRGKKTDSRNEARHIHLRGISRFGGVALILSFIGTLLLDERLVLTTPLLGVLIASGAILIYAGNCNFFFNLP